jgi:hypothetical protein
VQAVYTVTKVARYTTKFGFVWVFVHENLVIFTKLVKISYEFIVKFI